MKVKSPISFRTKSGEVVVVGDAVNASDLKDYQLSTKPEPYETKVVREVPADEPRATDTAPKTRKAKKAD